MDQIDTSVETRYERKSLDVILREAFMQGVRHGARYPEYEAIPERETELQFRAFKDDLQGNTWGPDQWLAARKDAQAQMRIEHAKTEAGLW